VFWRSGKAANDRRSLYVVALKDSEGHLLGITFSFFSAYQFYGNDTAIENVFDKPRGIRWPSGS
jgi:hypothetical protein